VVAEEQWGERPVTFKPSSHGNRPAPTGTCSCSDTDDNASRCGSCLLSCAGSGMLMLPGYGAHLPWKQLWCFRSTGSELLGGSPRKAAACSRPACPGVTVPWQGSVLSSWWLPCPPVSHRSHMPPERSAWPPSQPFLHSQCPGCSLE